MEDIFKEITTSELLQKLNNFSLHIASFGASIPIHPELAVDTQEAKEILVSKDAELVCVRSWPEFIGEVSGLH